MKRYFKRVTSMLLVLCMVLALLSATVCAQNSNRRGTVCTDLSAKAKAYYTGNYTYDVMSELQGGTSNCLTTVNCALFQRLHSLMDSTMTNSVTYKKLTNYWPTTDNSILFYSDTSYSGNVSREHVWPKSRASFKESNGGCDLHHLRPENSNVNSTRSNYSFGNVRDVISGCSTYSYGGKTVLWYSDPRDLVEVNDNIKGDVARVLLYVYVRWEEPNLFMATSSPVVGPGDDANNGRKVIESLDTLLSWCEMDPVDTWEMSRNDEVQSVQGNRNVFIDYPEYAWLLFGQDIPEDMKTPSGKAAESNPYTLTAASNNTAYGTVTLSGKTITATPKTGYEIDSANPYTVSPSGAATVTLSGNTFKVSKMTADCTVTVNFKARTAATILYHVPTGVTVSGTTSAYVGDRIALATVSGSPSDTTHSYTFVGWGSSEVELTTTKPTVKAAGSSYTVTAETTTFYGVYSYQDGGVAYYLTDTCAHESTHEERTEPTCDKAGKIETVCDNCGAVVATQSIAKLGHNHERTTVEPTCTEKGYDLYTCTRCGDSYKKNYTAALGHDFADGSCTRCGEADPDYRPVETLFPDIYETDWYYNYVMAAAEAKLVNGYNDGTFRPSNSLTRAEAATLLYRLSGSPEATATASFSDLPNEWYREAIAWAETTGVVTGYPDGTFRPDETVTREQFVTMLWRLEGKPETLKELEGFEDTATVSEYARTAFAWAVENGIVNGTTSHEKEGTYLAPKDNIKRCEVAKILCVFCDLI